MQCGYCDETALARNVPRVLGHFCLLCIQSSIYFGPTVMSSSPRITPLRVLVVDDEANIRMTLSMCLKAEGHQVVAHGTIDDALAAAAIEAFDLIFLDLRLGTDNGLDYIPQLLSQNPWTRIIVITAYASVET